MTIDNDPIESAPLRGPVAGGSVERQHLYTVGAHPLSSSC
jgi:hypothetical protein